MARSRNRIASRAQRTHRGFLRGSQSPSIFEQLDADDSRIVAATQQCLRKSGYSELKTLGVAVSKGNVELSGTISSHYLKQVAQSLVLAVPGVRKLHNSIVVRQIS